MISVIIPLYNKEGSIRNTLLSVINQTYIYFEIIIVDDGSTDKSIEVVSKFDDNRIRIIKKENGGVSSARNLGIENSKFDYLAFIDGDDEWHENHLSEIVRLISYKDDAYIYACRFTKDRSMLNYYNKNLPIEIISDFYLAESFSDTYLSSSSFAFNKIVLQGLDYFYNINLKYGEDVEFWYRILKNRTLLFSHNITVYYNTMSENRSNHIMPLKNRFHNFIFSGKSISEKQFLGKLVALVIIDYITYKSYFTSLKVFFMYIFNFKYIYRYFRILLLKKIRN